MRSFLLKVRTSFGSCICDYADKTNGDTSATPASLENDVMKADVLNSQKVEEGKRREELDA
jgi:hypothetical protein